MYVPGVFVRLKNWPDSSHDNRCGVVVAQAQLQRTIVTTSCGDVTVFDMSCWIMWNDGRIVQYPTMWMKSMGILIEQ